MSSPFLSSEEYDERAHALYNEGRYDEALDLLRDGLNRYPEAVELHVGMGYARLARDEYAWARQSFAQALLLDEEHEDALAGIGEVLLMFGRTEEAMAAFEQTVALGYEDDVDLMLQIGRALFREGFTDLALTYFERAATQAPDSVEAIACVGYALHRLGQDTPAIAALRQALVVDPSFTEARVYLANVLYDTGALDAALVEFDQTAPADHWDELGLYRAMELKKSVYRLPDDDPEFTPWEARLEELAAEPDAIDALLNEVEQQVLEQEDDAAAQAQGQLEALGGLLNGLAQQHEPLGDSQADELRDSWERDVMAADGPHRVIMRDGSVFEGTWEEIVLALRDARDAGRPLDEYMAREARRFYGATGARIASHAPDVFLRDSAKAGMLRIER